ncbi:MAG: 30S ribosomal protein S2 [Nitrospinae bacterium]|nr:30S ribosomal protein S2 [Nitrospinota bacterium]
MAEVTLQEMMEAGVHFGHQTKRWNPKMKRYIFGARNGIYIIDLQKSLKLFQKAVKFAHELGANGGTLLFLGTKPQAKDVIVENAGQCKSPFVIERWLGGMLTNFETIRRSVARMKELDAMAEDGTFEALSKKEVVKLAKEREKLVKNLGGIRNMDKLPDAMFIIDTKNERIALNEARRLNIPVIAIVDTNCDPDGIDFVIPGNDDALKSIKLITGAISEAHMAGKTNFEMRLKALAEEKAAMKKQAEPQNKGGAQDKDAAVAKEQAGEGGAAQA